MFIGLDVGSITAKAVLLDDDRGVIWRGYGRHGSRQADKVEELLDCIESATGVRPRGLQTFITGSGAGLISERLGARYVHEVNAVAAAAERLCPDVGSVVELGGQDAKMLVFERGPDSNRGRKLATMNDKCAGGTGAMIDKIAAKIGLDPPRLQSKRFRDVPVHPIAGKCGVFAETDVNSLINAGVPEEQLIASLFDAIVTQNLTVLTRGNILLPGVLLLGGPHAYLPGLVEAWQHHIPRVWSERGLDLPVGASTEELIAVPPDAEYFGALGAVEFGLQEQGNGIGPARQGAAGPKRGLGSCAGKPRSGPGLSPSRDELRAFLARYDGQPAQVSPPGHGETVECFLGLDGGSTSVKAVLLDRHGAVLAKSYRLSAGNPVEDARAVLLSLRAELSDAGAGVLVRSAGVTGYAKDVLAQVIGADTAIVETVAHARSALQWAPDTDVICDVGGQDIKIMVLDRGRVKDFRLNTQCSAGNGYFLQNTAERFGLDVAQYADAAFTAARSPEFGYGCAVFLQSDIVDFQRRGWSPEEILAGLARVLPKNVWMYVARIANLPALGSNFLLQGGTQRNLAAVKAQVDFIRSRFDGSGRVPSVAVHPHCGEAGAVGAALEAHANWQPGQTSGFIGFDGVQALRYRTTRGEETRCGYCRNACVRTFIDLEPCRPGATPPGAIAGRAHPRQADPRRVVAGHGCDRGLAADTTEVREIKLELDVVRRANPDLADRASRLVWRSFLPRDAAPGMRSQRWPWSRRRSRMAARERLRIGIPRALNMYSVNPLFSAYFESLGIRPRNLVYSDFTTAELYRDGARRGAIDPCYPSKVALAHVHNLLFEKHRNKPLDLVFFPMLDTLDSDQEFVQGACACPTVTMTPQTVRAAFTRERDTFRDLGISYLCPMLNLDEPAYFERQLFAAFRDSLDLSRRENRIGVAHGYAALARYKAMLRARGREMLRRLEEEGRVGIVVLGRSYHADPGINHGILAELRSRGYPILTQDTLPLDPELLERIFRDDLASGAIRSPLDIGDVWANSYSAGSNRKIWAARFAARHPNLVALELSSFKCGHDAPIYTAVEELIEASGTPFFAFKDLDENHPAGSVRIRIETIDHALRRYGASLRAGRPVD